MNTEKEAIPGMTHTLVCVGFVPNTDPDESRYHFSYKSANSEMVTGTMQFELTVEEIENIAGGGTWPFWGVDNQLTPYVEGMFLCMVYTLHACYWYDKPGCLVGHAVSLV